MKIMTKKIFITLVMACLAVSPVLAQQTTEVEFINDSDIPSEEIKEASARVVDKVNDFVHALSMLTCSKCGYSDSTKALICSDALALFLGEGDPYPVRIQRIRGKDTMWVEQTAPAVAMQFLRSKWNPDTITRLTKEYLYSLINDPFSRKKHVTVGKAKGSSVRIDNVNKVADGLYVAIVTIKLRTIRLNQSETRILYQDDTEKKVEVYMQRVVTQTVSGHEIVQWIIKLGDIYAVKVE